MTPSSNDSDESLDPASFFPAPGQESADAVELVRELELGLRDKLPGLQQAEIISTVQEILDKRSASYFSGPQPPPELLAQYEQICPGWATRLLEMGERQQLHRIECERETLNHQIEYERQTLALSRARQELNRL